MKDKQFNDARILLEAAVKACLEENKIFSFECPLCRFDEAIGIVSESGIMMAECPGCRKSITLKGLR